MDALHDRWRHKRRRAMGATSVNVWLPGRVSLAAAAAKTVRSQPRGTEEWMMEVGAPLNRIWHIPFAHAPF